MYHTGYTLTHVTQVAHSRHTRRALTRVTQGSRVLVRLLHRGGDFISPLHKHTGRKLVTSLIQGLGPGTPSEVSLHAGSYLCGTGRRGGGVSELGGCGQLQLLELLDVIVTQGQELIISLLHGVGLLGRITDTGRHV